MKISNGMKKTNLKLHLITTFIFVLIFSIFSGAKIFAQTDSPIVSTMGYSILSPNSFVFSGYYANNFEKKPFTTFFEFKKHDKDFTISAGSSDLLEAWGLIDEKQETIKIVRDIKVDQNGYFHSSPELNLFSDYFFRAVGYFNDNPSEKFYGDVFNIRTGYIPAGSQIPFTIEGVNVVKPYDPTEIVNGIYVVDVTENTTYVRTNIFNKNAESLSLKIEYGTEDYDKETDFLKIVNNKSASVLIKDLKSSTKYYFRIFDTTNKLDPSSEGSFVTNEASDDTEDCTLDNTGNCDSGDGSGDNGDGNNDNSGSGTTTGTPVLSDASDTGLVKCGTQYYQEDIVIDGKQYKEGQVSNPCGFNDILTLINDVLDFIFTRIALPFAAIMFAYAGFELLTSGGEVSKREKAKKIFINVAIGLVVVAAAFLIVQTVLLIAGARTDININWFGF